MGIAAIFVFQITFFLAVLALDERRVGERRNFCCGCCIQYDEDYEPNKCSQQSYMHKFFTNIYAPFITKLPVKVTDIKMARLCIE